MSAVQPLCHLMGIDSHKISKEENVLLEAELFIRIYKELNELFRKQYQNYFYLMKFTKRMEETMLDTNFIRFVIKDILTTEEYSLAGIAYYTNTHEDVLLEIIAGCNTSPSAIFQRKIIELHREVKRDLYHQIIKKITLEYLAAA